MEGEGEEMAPGLAPRPPALLAAAALGALEGAAVVVYGLSILVSWFVQGTSGVAGRTEVASPILAVLVVVLGVLLGAVTWALWQRKAAARTPFVLAQAFVVVAAWSLATADSGALRAVGIAVIVLAVAAALAAIAATRALVR